MSFNPPARTGLTREASRTPDHLGCQLAYWMDGSGPPVLFIQGTGLHGHGWLSQIDELSRAHSCLWFDNRGMGKSTPVGTASLSVEQMAQDALHVMDAAAFANCHVVGHSLGGCIALQLALSSPERVRSLALLCTAADGPALVRLDLAMLWRGIRMKVGSMASRRSAFLELVLTRAQHAQWDLAQVAAELEPFYGHDLGVIPPVPMTQVRAMGAWNVLDRLDQLATTPTLVVSADQDLIARPALVRSTAQAIPSAHLVELSDAAHGVTVTDPERINQLLAQHVADAESRS